MLPHPYASTQPTRTYIRISIDTHQIFATPPTAKNGVPNPTVAPIRADRITIGGWVITSAIGDSLVDVHSDRDRVDFGCDLEGIWSPYCPFNWNPGFNRFFRHTNRADVGHINCDDVLNDVTNISKIIRCVRLVWQVSVWTSYKTKITTNFWTDRHY